MGSSSSAQTAAAQGASTEEMPFLSEPLPEPLPDDHEAPLQESLARAQGDVVEVNDEVAAPAEAGDLISPGSAPFLAEFLVALQARTAAVFGDEENMFKLAVGDPEGDEWWSKVEQEGDAWFEKEAKPLLEKSFKHFDPSDSNTLDEREAAVFFAHLVHEETKFEQMMSALELQTQLKLLPKVVRGAVDSEVWFVFDEENALDGDDWEMVQKEVDQAIKAIEKEMRKATEEMKVDTAKREEDYRAHKAERDAAAFKVLDTNGDGTLQLAEFINAFQLDSEMHGKLGMALGLRPSLDL